MDNKTITEKINAVSEALRDFNTYQELNQLHVDMIYFAESIGSSVDNFNVDINRRSITVTDSFDIELCIISIFKGHTYESLLDCEGVELGHNAVTLKKTFTKTLRNGTKLICVEHFSSYIPDEEMEMLELLGKVNVEVIPAQLAKVSKSVFCPTGQSSGVPF